MALLLFALLVVGAAGVAASGGGRQDLRALRYVMAADSVSTQLRRFLDKELSLSKLETLLKAQTIEAKPTSPAAILAEVTSTMGRQWDSFAGAVTALRDRVLELHASRPVGPTFRHFRQCCAVSKDQLTYDRWLGYSVNDSFACDVLPPSSVSTFTFQSFYPATGVAQTFSSNLASVGGSLGSQWVATAEGARLEFPAQPLRSRNASQCRAKEVGWRTPDVLALARPFPKRVVILLEYGNLVSEPQLERVRAVARLLLDSVGGNDDLVAVVGVGDEANSPCPSLLPATAFNRARLRDFIDSQPRVSRATNHSRGFVEAFRILGSSVPPPGSRDFVFYVSRGLLKTLSQKGHVMATLAETQLAAAAPVQINTFPVIEQRPLWETQFLGDVATQNFAKHKASFSPDLQVRLKAADLKPPIGKMVVVNASSVDSALPLTVVLQLFGEGAAPEDKDALTYFQPTDGGKGRRVIRAALGLWSSEGAWVGAVGAELELGSLTAALRATPLPDASHRLLLLHRDGWVVEDQWLPRLRKRLGLDELDGWQLPATRRRWMLGQLGGRISGRLSAPVCRADNSTVELDYTWARVSGDSSLVLVYVSPSSPDKKLLTGGLATTKQSFVGGGVSYHRLDLGIGAHGIHFHCMLLNQLATTDVCGLYLSPLAFREAAQRDVEGESEAAAIAVWAHLTDSTRLISNQNLRQDVKTQASLVSRLATLWKGHWEADPTSVLRRFFLTTGGALLSHPAVLLPIDFRPHQREWYRRALERPGSLALSGPYLDPSGAGFVVTLSRAVAQGSGSFGVGGVDVPSGLLLSLLHRGVGLCSGKGMDCLLLDPAGYVLGAGNPEAPHLGERQPAEAAHLSHRQPRLAVELLGQDDPVLRKRACRRPPDSLQREYRLETAGGLRSGRESCGRWELAALPRAQAHLLFLNSSGCGGSRGAAAFCPCSVTDRRCLNCRRESEAQDCECPCQCPLDAQWDRHVCPLRSRGSSPGSEPPLVGNCAPEQAPFRLAKVEQRTLSRLFNSDGASLPQCAPSTCAAKKDALHCLSTIGCGWCERAEDGRTRLSEPHCGPISTCFDGVQGRSPDGDYSYLDGGLAVSTPVGPVAGAIIGIFVLLVIGVYCYRYQVTRLVEGRGSHSGSGARLHLNQEEEEFAFDVDGSKPCSSGACGAAVREPLRPHELASFERQAPMGAPRPAVWRHGPRTESSDHGYSTMTGNAEDSASNVDAAPILLRPSRRLSAQGPETDLLLRAAACRQKDPSRFSELLDLSSGKESTLVPSGADTTLDSSALRDDSTTVVIAADVHRPPMEPSQ